MTFLEIFPCPSDLNPSPCNGSHEQVTVHSDLMKYQTEKFYHPYLSQCKIQDQNVVDCVIEKMMSLAEVNADKTTIIESIIMRLNHHNCSSQCKLHAHFQGIQRLSSKYHFQIIRVFGIPEHRKGEVDHVEA